MFVCKVLFFCTFHLSSFLPPLFAPTPLLNARLPTTHIAHHPSPPRTTPHNTTHTLHNVAPPQHTPLALGSAVATLRTLHAPQSTYKPLHHNSPQHCTQSHNVVKSGTNLVISTVHTSHNVVQSEITHYILYTFLF